jgi:hypothetical protein
MTHGPWLALLERQCLPAGAPGWDDLLAGYDFGLLPAEEIQRWVAARPAPGPAARALAVLAGPHLAGFEAALWAAVAEATGKTPRPGSDRWARAQDRWRLALLRDAMAAPVCDEALALLVEAIYGAVGCPEDMIELWRPARAGAPAIPDRGRIRAFIRRREAALAPAKVHRAAWKKGAQDAQGSGIPLG